MSSFFERGVPDVKRLVRILDEMKNKRRTLADVVDGFRQHTDFGENDSLKIQVDGLRLPSGNVVGLIQIVFDSESVAHWSSLPSSVQFRARRQGSSELTLFDIFDLDGAIADSDGNVSTAGGARLRTVEVIPAALPYHISDLDQSIVFRTIQLLGVEGKCFRSLREGAEPEFEAMIPDLNFFICSKLTH